MRLLTNEPRAIERALREAKDEPLRLACYASAAALPPAGDWTNGLVRVEDINMLAFSNGAHWYRADTGVML